MNLLYPKPKCKFGTNDKIVSATYVRCTEKPLSVEDIEGKHAERVSTRPCEPGPEPSRRERFALILTVVAAVSRPTTACSARTVHPTLRPRSCLSPSR